MVLDRYTLREQGRQAARVPESGQRNVNTPTLMKRQKEYQNMHRQT